MKISSDIITLGWKLFRLIRLLVQSNQLENVSKRKL
jgi:hypothetical protein